MPGDHSNNGSAVVDDRGQGKPIDTESSQKNRYGIGQSVFHLDFPPSCRPGMWLRPLRLIVLFHPFDYLTLFESNVVLEFPVHWQHPAVGIAVDVLTEIFKKEATSLAVMISIGSAAHVGHLEPALLGPITKTSTTGGCDR